MELNSVLQVKFLVLVLCWTFVSGNDPPPTFSGKDVTSVLFPDKTNEEFFPAAFGDFNSDKLTDIIAIARDRGSIILYLSKDEEPLLYFQQQCNLRTDAGPVLIHGVTVGDFNGDGLVDVMVTFNQTGVREYKEVQIFAGNGTYMKCEAMGRGIEVLQEPLVVDVDGDMILDLIGEVWDGETEENKQQSSSSNDHSPTTPKPGTKHPSREDQPLKKVWKFFPNSTLGFTHEVYDFITVSEIPDERMDHLVKYGFKRDLKRTKMSKPTSNAVVDVDGDNNPDLVFTTVLIDSIESHPQYFVERYRIRKERKNSKGWEFGLFAVVPLDPVHKKGDKGQNTTDTINVVGQPLFLDLNQDGNLLHILPFCTKKNCQTSKFKVISNDSAGNATDLDVSFQDEKGNLWSFLKLNHDGGVPWFNFYYKAGVVLRVGDYNMDGFPDLIGVLMTKEGSEDQKDYRAVIFENVPCTTTNPKEPCPYPRTFRIDFQSLSSFENVTMATFFDIYEDGLIDVLLVRRTNPATKKDQDKYAASGYLSNPDYDANFLKVMVTSGRPCPRCKKSNIPYGNIIPGPVLRYELTTQEGVSQKAVAAQMYRSSHTPLDLPYTIFGTGHSPNFIDSLDVGVSNQKISCNTDKWLQLIPNSQIIVIPPNPDVKDSRDWKAKIFLPSTKAPLHTFLVLLGFCGAICIIAGILQWRERREDKKERLLETHRFMM